MTSSLVNRCLDLAWSQWGELGVSVSGARVPEYGVDLEPAILFAASLADFDARLHDEALDWCIHFANHFVSVSVLKHTLRLFDPEHQELFSSFAAVVNSLGGAKWPTTSAARSTQFRPSGKSVVTVGRAGAIQLRARKVFGINARADIISAFAQQETTGDEQWVHVNGLSQLGYTKRNLTDALNDLALGQLLGTMRFDRVLYSPRNPNVLRELLAPIPSRGGKSWAQILATAAKLLRVEQRTRRLSMVSQAVEVRKTLDVQRPLLERVRIKVPDLDAGDPWPQLDTWLAELLEP